MTQLDSRGLGIEEAELTERVADAMKQASRSYVEAIVRMLSLSGYAGLTPSLASLLTSIPVEGAQAVSLAGTKGHSKQAIAKLIRELEHLGYVRRVADPNDRRGQLVFLSDRGKGVVEQGLRIKTQLAGDAVAVLGASRMEQLHKELKELAALFSEK